MKAPKAAISEAVRMRGETDHIMTPLWIIAPLLGIVIGALMGTLVATKIATVGAGIMIAGYVAAIVLTVYPLYHLIKRRTAHFRRDAGLREGIINYLKAKAGTRKRKEINSGIATMNLIHSEAMGEEREKSAAVWTILTFLVPFIGIYVLYFLTADPQNHDRRQASFMQQVQSAGSKLGLDIVVPSWKALPSRSFALYFILSIVTGGFFGIYWYYVFLNDFNEHFKGQRQFEDQLISSIS